MAISAKVIRKRWGEWHYSQSDSIPSTDTALSPDVAVVLDSPALTSSSGASQVAATSISYTISAWPVVATETRDCLRGDASSEYRQVTVGWIIRTTRCSRWEGEGSRHGWVYQTGGQEPVLRWMFDCRFAEAAEEKTFPRPVEIWKIRKFFRATAG